MRRIKAARVVVTDFFHGAAVSLRFGRPVLVGASPGKEIKITDLLNRIGLTELYFKDGAGVPAAVRKALDDPKAFGVHITNALAPYQTRSANYLERALATETVRS